MQEDLKLQYVDNSNRIGSKYYSSIKLAEKLKLDKEVQFKVFVTPKYPDRPGWCTEVMVTEAFAVHCGIQSPPEAKGKESHESVRCRKTKHFTVYSHGVEFELLAIQGTTLKAILYFVKHWGSSDAKVKTNRAWYRLDGTRTNNRHGHHTVYNVYFMYCQQANAVKIGIARNLTKRLVSLQIGNPYLITPLAYIECPNKFSAIELEQQLHQKFKKLNIRGEWFEFEGELKSYLKP